MLRSLISLLPLGAGGSLTVEIGREVRQVGLLNCTM